MGYQNLLKHCRVLGEVEVTRPLDFLLALVAALILLPFLVPILILLRFTGDGEVFYYQKRKGKDGKLKASFNQRGKENFDNIATNESLKGNLASTQKKDSKGNIILAPNGQPMIVGPIRTGPFGTTGGYSPSKQSASYKIKDGKVVYDKPKKTFKGGTPKKGTGASGAPGRNFSTPSRTKEQHQ